MMNQILNVSFDNLQIKEIDYQGSRGTSENYDAEGSFDLRELFTDYKKEQTRCIIICKIQINNKVIEIQSSEIGIDKTNLSIKLYINNGLKLRHNKEFSEFCIIYDFI